MPLSSSADEQKVDNLPTFQLSMGLWPSQVGADKGTSWAAALDQRLDATHGILPTIVRLKEGQE
jgi:hypothetical protein